MAKKTTHSYCSLISTRWYFYTKQSQCVKSRFFTSLLMERVMTLITTIAKTSVLIFAVLAVPAAYATDQDLLDILLQNGVLNKAQHAKLSLKASHKEAEKKVQQAAKTDYINTAFAWASRIKISGDMRVRQENIESDKTGVKESRQRLRARLKLTAKVNAQVNVGFRLVTGAGQATSTNQTIEGSFGGKDVYFDRAYLSWHPDFINQLTATVGKFKQPWYNVSSHGLLWDSDVNPEGVALIYKTTVAALALNATGGYFIIEDGDTVKGKRNNDGFSDDLTMYHAGVSGSMQVTDAIKGSLGSNIYIYNNESKLAGNNTALEIYEVASKFDLNTRFLPVYVYAQYVTNASAKAGQDNAWLAGFGGKYRAFKADYNYRDTQQYAVADAFNDGDFATGNTAARGHKIKLAYLISKNFSTSLAYYAAEEYAGNSIDTFQLDLKAKF